MAEALPWLVRWAGFVALAGLIGGFAADLDRVAKEKGLRLRSGTCAVMYLSHGFSPHTIHGFFRKLKGTY